MKYYLNIQYNLLDDKSPNPAINNQCPIIPRNDDFRYPTAPMYQQDGVYNQLCKYRLVNFQITGLTDAQVEDLSDTSLVLSMTGTPSRNSFNIFNYGPPNVPIPAAGLFLKNGLTPVQFHIRLEEGILQYADSNVPKPNGKFYNMAMRDGIAEEVVGAACWGNAIDFDLFKYSGAIDAQKLLHQADMLLTLEVEPIFEKI